MPQSQESVTLAQAYENIAQAVAAYRGTLNDHQLLQQSLQTIKQTLQQAQQAQMPSVPNLDTIYDNRNGEHSSSVSNARSYQEVPQYPSH